MFRFRPQGQDPLFMSSLTYDTCWRISFRKFFSTMVFSRQNRVGGGGQLVSGMKIGSWRFAWCCNNNNIALNLYCMVANKPNAPCGNDVERRGVSSYRLKLPYFDFCAACYCVFPSSIVWCFFVWIRSPRRVCPKKATSSHCCWLRVKRRISLSCGQQSSVLWLNYI